MRIAEVVSSRWLDQAENITQKWNVMVSQSVIDPMNSYVKT